MNSQHRESVLTTNLVTPTKNFEKCDESKEGPWTENIHLKI